jgi:hypothetical protein
MALQAKRQVAHTNEETEIVLPISLPEKEDLLIVDIKKKPDICKNMNTL